MDNKNFKSLVDTGTKEFDAIFSLLDEEYRTKGRRLLCLVDKILDYYINREDDALKLPIIFIPRCEEWAQRACEDYVTLKMGLLFGEKNRKRIAVRAEGKSLVLPPGGRKRVSEYYHNRNDFFRLVHQNLTEDVMSYKVEDSDRAMIFSVRLNYESQKLEESFNRHVTSVKSLPRFNGVLEVVRERQYSPVWIVHKKTDAFYREMWNNVDDYEEATTKYPHNFVFLTKSPDGKRTEMTDVFDLLGRTYIEEYNKRFKTGIKNVFYFMFSATPYCLQKVNQKKRGLILDILGSRQSEYNDFISFTKEELDYIFDRDGQSEQTLILNSDHIDKDLKDFFDMVLHENDSVNELSLRNALSTILTPGLLEKSQETILSQFESEEQFGIKAYLKASVESCENATCLKLIDFVKDHAVKLILDYYTPDNYKECLVDYFLDLGAERVSVGTYRDFKQSGGKNQIEEDRIVVLSLLNHRTGKPCAFFPNSYDELYLNEGQQLLRIVNLMIQNPHYQYYQYEYEKELYRRLWSDFRKSVGIAVPKPQAPQFSSVPKEEDDASYRSAYVGNDTYSIRFTDANRSKTFNDDALFWVRFNNGDEGIYSTKELYENFEGYNHFKVKPLSDFHEKLDQLVCGTNDRDIVYESELYKKYNILQNEEKRQDELWNVLLRRKVASKGSDNVYDEVLNLLQQKNLKIGRTSFDKWIDPDCSQILPNMKMIQQLVIEEYLKLPQLYLRLLRRRKNNSSNNSENKNKKMVQLLSIILVVKNNDYKSAFDATDEDLRDYWGISNVDDFEALRNVLLDSNIDFKSIDLIKEKKK